MATALSTPAVRMLTAGQQAAIRTAMQLFAEEDRERGVSATTRALCDACQRGRPLPGFIRYGSYQLCNPCATAFELASAEGRITTPGQFVRDHRFGEADAYAVDGSR